MTSKENAVVIRKALRKVFGASNVSVIIGEGTARHWINVRIEVLENTKGDARPAAEHKANQIIESLKEIKAIELDTFSSDDGWGSSLDCLSLGVHAN